MSSASFTILGDVNVEIIVTEVIDPVTGLTNLEFQVNVLDETGSIGDLNALYFDLADACLTNSLSVDGGDVTGSVFKVDGVTKVDNYTNMNGEVIKDLGRFDGGVQFGTAGIGSDDNRRAFLSFAYPCCYGVCASSGLSSDHQRLTNPPRLRFTRCALTSLRSVSTTRSLVLEVRRGHHNAASTRPVNGKALPLPDRVPLHKSP